MRLNTVYALDCFDGLPDLKDNSIDLCLTDPPYNAKNIGLRQRKYSLGEMHLPEKDYMAFCRNWFDEVKRVSKNIVFTPGISNICRYPQPFWVICWHKPAACSFNRMGGYNAWEPIFIYGKPSKRIDQDYILVNTLNFKKGPEKEHPCPKQIDLWRWLVEHFSKEGEIVLDPFMGSGTTAVASKQLKRRFIGFEINPDYVEIAKERLKQEILFPAKKEGLSAFLP